MTLTQVWGALAIFIVCPLLGGLPLIDWITRIVTGQRLRQLGTGNISVSAAFYHGGKLAGILAVLSEALKGIAAVLLARAFFPTEPAWELIALIALVMGRYWMGKGAGTTNVVWGIAVHDPITAGLVFLIGGISFTILRDRRSGRLGVLVLLVIILALRHPQDSERVVAAIALAGLLAWIYTKIPDDLNLPNKSGGQSMFRFLRGTRALSLDDKLDSRKVGQKAAGLAQLKRWSYAVPDGWVLPAGDDPQPLINFLEPSVEQPLVVRSSAIGEDSETASAAGQYATFLNITNREMLQTAIFDCLSSYNNLSAVQYRRDRQQADRSMAVIVQKQIRGVYSGVAFSRDPLNQLNEAVVIEALPGEAAQVVSGQVTPQEYHVEIRNLKFEIRNLEDCIDRSKDVPTELLQAVAQLTREIEERHRGVPQDVEWTFDGEQLWVLQARPVTTLQPIWTRKIAAEVIPGIIRPLTWSINRPLTCGVWGEIFTLVLGKRAKDLDFSETATLHYSRSYFNATLLGTIFLRMGLPPESLEFLTRGAKMSKPSFKATLRNLPGLMRLLKRELQLEKDFYAEKDRYFAPILDELEEHRLEELAARALLERIETILSQLERATYYSILAPLSLALRQAMLKVPETELDNAQTPEVASMRSLSQLAADARNLLPKEQRLPDNCASLFANLAEIPDGESVLEQFKQWLNRYGYLSQVATDIAVPRWQEDPRPVKELFTQFLSNQQPETSQLDRSAQGFRTKLVQRRLQLKGEVGEVYSRLLAHLRWSFMALADQWQKTGIIEQGEDIFLLQFSEVRRLVEPSQTLSGREPKRELVTGDTPGDPLASKIERSDLRNAGRPQAPLFHNGVPGDLIKFRQTQFQQHQQLEGVPYVVYGNPTELPVWNPAASVSQLQGIGASPGQVEGTVKVLHNLQGISQIDQQTILVVPYTDSGWAPLLTRAGGLIAEVGGRLSHGAIVAREYGIPAVMDVHNATHQLRDGQRVRLDGQKGVIEVLD